MRNLGASHHTCGVVDASNSLTKRKDARERLRHPLRIICDEPSDVVQGAYDVQHLMAKLAFDLHQIEATPVAGSL